MAGFELRDRRPESAGHHGASRATQSDGTDRKSTRLNSSHGYISYAVFCLKKKIAAGKPFADVIVGVAFEQEHHAEWNKGAEALSGGALEMQFDRIFGQALGPIAAESISAH